MIPETPATINKEKKIEKISLAKEQYYFISNNASSYTNQYEKPLLEDPKIIN